MTEFKPDPPCIEDLSTNGEIRYVLKKEYCVSPSRCLKEYECALNELYRDKITGARNRMNSRASRGFSPDRVSLPIAHVSDGPITVDSLSPYGAIVVPAGFTFNGASIPKLVSALLPKIVFPYKPGDKRLIMSSLVHDWLYSNHQMYRWMSDDLFFCMLLQDEVSVYHASVMWEAVRFGGFGWWINDDKDFCDLSELCCVLHQRSGSRIDQYSFPAEVTEKC